MVSHIPSLIVEPATPEEHAAEFKSAQHHQRPFICITTNENDNATATVVCELIQFPFRLTSTTREELTDIFAAHHTHTTTTPKHPEKSWNTNGSRLYIEDLPLAEARNCANAIEQLLNKPETWKPEPLFYAKPAHKIELESHPNTDHLYWVTHLNLDPDTKPHHSVTLNHH